MTAKNSRAGVTAPLVGPWRRPERSRERVMMDAKESESRTGQESLTVTVNLEAERPRLVARPGVKVW